MLSVMSLRKCITKPRETLAQMRTTVPNRQTANVSKVAENRASLVTSWNVKWCRLLEKSLTEPQDNRRLHVAQQPHPRQTPKRTDTFSPKTCTRGLTEARLRPLTRTCPDHPIGVCTRPPTGSLARLCIGCTVKSPVQ